LRRSTDDDRRRSSAAFFAIYACAAAIRIRAENEALLTVMPPRASRQYPRPAAEAEL
jgi:hypothetical protein